jgi:formylglycine-generating enzyme required for sulfatase activity
MSAPRVFVSHSHKDDTFTQRLVQDLGAAGADVWVDVAGVGADDFQKRINQALQSCEWFVLVLTPAAIASPWVELEVHAAFRLKVQGRIRGIIQVLAAPVSQAEIPPTWGAFAHFDATSDYPAARNRVLRELGLAIPPQSTVPAQSRAPLSPPPGGTPFPPREGGQGVRSDSPVLPQRLASLGYVARANGTVEYILPPLCTVPAGEFLMGSDPNKDSASYGDERPQHRVKLPAYQVARFPVTVAEYACFVRTGHAEPKSPYNQLTWKAQLEGRPDHPVVNVAWPDAVAYAAWLAKQARRPWRLPSEAEWEKAARGTDGRIYPWGDAFDKSRCNTREGGRGATTPVGSYPHGASPCGAKEMVGNAWEWTSSDFTGYPYTPDGGRETSPNPGNKVRRGGSWNYDAKLARVAFRGAGQPVNYDNYYGFRLVLAAGE